MCFRCSSLLKNYQTKLLLKFEIGYFILIIKGKVKQIGMFQRDFFEANIYEDLLVNFKEDLENDCNFSLANGKVLEMVTAFCKCRGKLPSCYFVFEIFKKLKF